MKIETLKQQGLIVRECISGSNAYGLATETSDIDIKGVFVVREKSFFGLHKHPQVSDDTNDTVYFELARYVQLLLDNNPNIVELAATSGERVLLQHELMDLIRVEDFLSKKCAKTFGGYASSQLKRARGLNKKIVNPIDGPRKSTLEFCFVSRRNGSVALPEYLAEMGWRQSDCGLTKIPNMSSIYGLHHDPAADFSGVVTGEDSTEVMLSSIPKGVEQVALLYFNKEAYSSHCRDYKAYQDWVRNRNQARYESTVSHGKQYDAKNLMHTFRLLDMGIEIAETGTVDVARPNREFLLSIKSGEYEYDALVEMAEQKLSHLETAFDRCGLPEDPDMTKGEELLVRLRREFYTTWK